MRWLGPADEDDKKVNSAGLTGDGVSGGTMARATNLRSARLRHDVKNEAGSVDRESCLGETLPSLTGLLLLRPRGRNHSVHISETSMETYSTKWTRRSSTRTSGDFPVHTSRS